MADGSDPNRIVKKSDWTALPMSEECQTIEMNVHYSPENMALIKKGLYPEEMEDKWFIYYEEDESKLYLHRSWTGFCTFIVQFKEEEGGGGSAISVVASRNKEQYNSFGDENDVQNVKDVITYVLGAYP